MEKALEKNKVEHYAEGAGHKEKIAKGTTDVKPQDLTRKVPRNVPRTTKPVAFVLPLPLRRNSQHCAAC